MDAETLNDLLECSVCLERLDTTSKVLPCQHTFCRQCLENIVAAHKQLRCPECRVPIQLRIDELPPNVLLMRILGGMKSVNNGSSSTQTTTSNSSTPPTTTNSTATPAAEKPVDAPHTAAAALIDLSQPSEGQLPQLQPLQPVRLHHQHQLQHQNPPPSAQQQPHQLQQLQPQHMILPSNQSEQLQAISFQPSPQQPHCFTYNVAHPAGLAPQARALFDYVAKDQCALSFKKGDLIFLRERLNAHWFDGELNRRTGMFPVNHLHIVVPLAQPQCRALYDFRMGPAEEEGCLQFQKGAVIAVLRRVDQNWAEGRLGEAIGIFPMAFVEMNAPAKRMMAVAPQTSAVVGFGGAAAGQGPAPAGHATPASVAAQPSLPQVPNPTPVSADVSSPSAITSTTVASTTMTSPTSSSSSSTTTAPSSSGTPTTTSSSSSSDGSSNSNPSSPWRTFGANSAVTVAMRNGNGNSNHRAQQQGNNEHKRHSLHVLQSQHPPPATSQQNPNRHSAEILSAPDDSPSTSAGDPSSNTARNLQQQLHHRRSHPNPTTSGHTSSTSASSSRNSSNTQQNHQQHRDSTPQRSSRPSSTSKSHPQTLPAPYVALYPYKPHKSDELELRKGTVYTVTERCQDGWFKGLAMSASGRSGQKSGVFPGNYVAPVRHKLSAGSSSGSASSAGSSQRDRNQLANLKQQQTIHQVQQSGAGPSSLQLQSPQHSGMYQRGSGSGSSAMLPPPELPPRSSAPSASSDSVWTKPLGQHVESFFSRKSQQPSTAKTESNKESANSSSSTISLMKRLTSIKRSKSPPPTSALQGGHYSMDNPVFEDASGEAAAAMAAAAATAVATTAASVQPTTVVKRNAHLAANAVHVRSGSCPSQLLHNLSLDVGGGGNSSASGGSQRQKAHKERPQLHGLRSDQPTSSTPNRHQPQTQHHQHPQQHHHPSRLSGSHLPNMHSTSSSSSQHHPHSSNHRKSHSLDATTIASQMANGGGRTKPSSSAAQQTPAERFRCIVPYPPNSEFELELNVDDIVLVHKKRENGWYKGTHGRTGRIGLFPASFVEPAA